MATVLGNSATSGRRLQRQPSAEQARRLGWWAAGAGLPTAWLVLLASGMHLEPIGATCFGALVLMLMALHLIYRRWRPDDRIELAAGILAMLIVSAVCAGIISNASLRLGRPLADDLLRAADSAMGIDTPRLVTVFVGHPVGTAILDLCYASALPLVMIIALLLAVLRREDRVWELGWTFSACILVSSVISVLCPAVGNIAHAGLGGLSGAGLPAGAGTFHLAAFHELYGASSPWLDLRRLEGLVTFPSFHLDMALIVAWACRRTGISGWIAGAWSLAVIVSTIPIGGHYVIDLVGGTCLWLAVLSIGRERQPAKLCEELPIAP